MSGPDRLGHRGGRGDRLLGLHRGPGLPRGAGGVGWGGQAGVQGAGQQVLDRGLSGRRGGSPHLQSPRSSPRQGRGDYPVSKVGLKIPFKGGKMWGDFGGIFVPKGAKIGFL